MQDQLDQFAPGTDVFNVIHDFQTATLVDGIVGAKNGSVKGIAKGRVTSPSLNSTVNLTNPASYAAAGAPANGADYVALRDGSGQIMNAKGLKSLSFQGAATLVPEALKWTSVAEPAGPRRQRGALVGQHVQPRRQCCHPGDGADGQPDADLQRAAPG